MSFTTCEPFAAAIRPWVHAFTERGTPAAPCDFGPAGEDSDVRRDLRRRLRHAIGLPGSRLALPRQVHGARVVEADDGFAAPRADGVLVRGAGPAPAVRTADCVPVLLVDAAAEVAAAVHAGWRGVAARIVPEALRALGRRGGDVTRIAVAIGPSIGGCCFEVAPPVARAIEDAVDGRDLRGGGGDRSVDLGLAVERQLRRAGVPGARIWRSPNCTRCEADRWFSHRREGTLAGRQVAVVGRPRND